MVLLLNKGNYGQIPYSTWKSYFFENFKNDKNEKINGSFTWLPANEAIFFAALVTFIGSDIRFIALKIHEIFHFTDIKKIIIHYDRILRRINVLGNFYDNDIEGLDVKTLHYIIFRFRKIMQSYGFHLSLVNGLKNIIKKQIAELTKLDRRNNNKCISTNYSNKFIHSSDIKKVTHSVIKTNVTNNFKVSLYLEPSDERTRYLSLKENAKCSYYFKMSRQHGIHKIFQFIKTQLTNQKIEIENQLSLMGICNNKNSNILLHRTAIFEIKSCHFEGLTVGHITYSSGFFSVEKIKLTYLLSVKRIGFKNKEFRFMAIIDKSLPPQ